MSGAEVIGIIACVAGVISAYHDGGAIIQKIKAKRAARRAPPPPRLLEESIDQAPGDIEREKQRGIQRFGEAFKQGDHIAVIALQQITIQLQGSLLEQLRKAAFDDEVRDFTYLVDEADLGRDRTVNTLIELKQRLLQASPINELSPLSPTSTLANAPSLVVGQAQGNHASLTASSPPPKSAQPARQPSDGARRTSNVPQAPAEEVTASGADAGADGTKRKRKSSLFGILKGLHRSDSQSDKAGLQSPSTIEEEPRRGSQMDSPNLAALQPPHTNRTRSSSNSSHQRQTSAYQYPEGWANDTDVWGSEGRTEAEHRRSMTIPPEQRQPVAAMDQTLSTSPTEQSQGRRLTPIFGSNVSTAISMPTAENGYLGFCKSAVRLQNGDRKAMDKRKEFNDGWSSSNVYYLACASSKCAFAGNLPLDTIWGKVFSSPSKGVKLRWPFLAKSHVPQLKAKDQQFAYQCPFCVLRGVQTPVQHGTECFIDHLQEHRGQELGEVVRYKTHCINDREADDSEAFDINLLPLDATQDRKQSAVLSDSLLGLGIGSRANQGREIDSMFSANSGGNEPYAEVGANEPWNEDLSDFHRYDDVDRSELE